MLRGANTHLYVGVVVFIGAAVVLYVDAALFWIAFFFCTPVSLVNVFRRPSLDISESNFHVGLDFPPHS